MLMSFLIWCELRENGLMSGLRQRDVAIERIARLGRLAGNRYPARHAGWRDTSKALFGAVGRVYKGTLRPKSDLQAIQWLVFVACSMLRFSAEAYYNVLVKDQNAT
jgi:hypothetical protein